MRCEKGDGGEDREGLQRGAGGFFSVDASRLTRQAMPDLFWEKGGTLGLEGNSTPNGPRLVARWRVPALGDHLDNLDLEGEPDGGLAAKEQKKVRRAARKLLETHGQPRRPRWSSSLPRPRSTSTARPGRSSTQRWCTLTPVTGGTCVDSVIGTLFG